MRTYEEVIEWLRDKKCLNLYYRNYRNRGDWQYARNNITSQLQRGNGLVNDAFRWSDTPEGHSFWDDINNEFLDWY